MSETSDDDVYCYRSLRKRQSDQLNEVQSLSTDKDSRKIPCCRLWSHYAFSAAQILSFTNSGSSLFKGNGLIGAPQEGPGSFPQQKINFKCKIRNGACTLMSLQIPDIFISVWANMKLERVSPPVSFWTAPSNVALLVQLSGGSGAEIDLLGAGVHLVGAYRSPALFENRVGYVSLTLHTYEK